jgi:hypothetical protein
VECQDRVERRAIRDRVAVDRQQLVRDLMLKGDLTSWLDQRLDEVQHCQVGWNNYSKKLFYDIFTTELELNKSRQLFFTCTIKAYCFKQTILFF